MHRNHFVKSLFLGLFIVPLCSCLSPGQEPTVGSGIDLTKVNTIDGNMYFKVETARYDTPDVKTTKATCQILAGDPSTTKTCTVTIPEEELYYSKFYMTFGTAAATASACKVIIFKPFAYLASYDAAFIAPWGRNASAVDCSRSTAGSTLGAGCYNGAAKEIVPSFPDKTFIHFFPDEGVEGKAAVSSPYEAGMGYDNTWITNNLTDRATAINLANNTATSDRYIGTTLTTTPGGLAKTGDMVYQDWGVYCMNEYYEPVYEIIIKIADQDIVTGENPGDPVLDDFYDWVGL